MILSPDRDEINMHKEILALMLVCSLVYNANGQSKPIVSGPMLGHTELRSAQVWLEFAKGISSASVLYKRKGRISDRLQTVTNNLTASEFNTTVFTLGGLEPGTTYSYYVSAGDDKRIVDSGELTTQALWQFRSAAPDFTFLAGSCAYFNEREYDRPGTPYGGNDSLIFNNMSREDAKLMIWLGDNWYTREVDYHSSWGLSYRASRDRQTKALRTFLKKMPHYAVWDDHDYGPNDADKSYHLKDAARQVFMNYWANPSYGMKNEGIYTRFSYSDVDFFLLDDRWWRSNDRMKDSIDGKPNPSKRMFGDEQMDWLKNSLLYSNTKNGTNFRIIVTGSQMLNQASMWDAFRKFPAEYADFVRFLEENKIGGVLFLTGDRHHSEVIRLARQNTYPLYDITISPLTASAAKTQGAEAANPGRVTKEVAVQNYGRITISGQGKNRKLVVEMKGMNGELLERWEVAASELTLASGGQ
jgi:alkaline phosphatase D